MKRCISFLLLSGVVGAAASTAALGAGISSSLQRETLSPDETQFFSLGSFATGEVVFGITTPIEGVPFDFDTPDTVVATFFSSDVGPGDLSPFVLTINDDSDADNNLDAPNGNDGDSFGSLFRLETMADDFTVGVTGFGDDFEGAGHGESGDYLLTIGHVDPTSLGGDFADSDGANEMMAGADLLPLGEFDSLVSVNSLVPGATGDVDFYRVDLVAGDVLTAMTAPLGGLSDDFDDPDTMIIVMDSNGNILLDDDEAGGPFSDLGINTFGTTDAHGSAVHFLAPATDSYFFAVTGFPDELAIGSHSEQGAYALLVSRARVIPEPSALALVLAGGLVCKTRRRRA
ncbi:MAG: PEP-CTERM sorting domain-containing protein [Planctomycetota bacterium]